jgi:hypothetical protein
MSIPGCLAGSSGVVEGLNNKAKITVRKAYGFRTFRATEIALRHALGNLPEPQAPTHFTDEAFLSTKSAESPLDAVCPHAHQCEF